LVLLVHLEQGVDAGDLQGALHAQRDVRQGEPLPAWQAAMQL